MGKKLVSEKQLDAVICAETNTVYAKGLILTPGAMDALKDRGVQVVFAAKPEGSAVCCGNKTPSAADHDCAKSDDSLVVTITEIMQTAFGSQSPDVWWGICERALAQFKDVG